METYVVRPDKLQEKALKALDVSFEKKKEEESLLVHVLTGIRKGGEDIKAGRSLSLEEFKEKISVNQ